MCFRSTWINVPAEFINAKINVLNLSYSHGGKHFPLLNSMFNMHVGVVVMSILKWEFVLYKCWMTSMQREVSLSLSVGGFYFTSPAPLNKASVRIIHPCKAFTEWWASPTPMRGTWMLGLPVWLELSNSALGSTHGAKALNPVAPLMLECHKRAALSHVLNT